MSYTGRFAPSPTGPLHFGSLLAALASYLDAKQQQGRWLLRIENLDPPREMPGATDSILRTLDKFGLHWDGEVIQQSQRNDYYNSLVCQLQTDKLAYRCSCSRSQLKQRHALHCYDGRCWQHPPPSDQPHAIRARFMRKTLRFSDRILGEQSLQPEHQGDFIIFRRDQLFAYQLAVVADDAAQGVTHVVRGADLLQETFAQLQLQQHLSLPTPSYAHLPLALNPAGQKLSKQNLAPAIESRPVIPTLLKALRFLQQPLPPEPFSLTVESLLQWAVRHWSVEQIPGTPAIHLED
ncbi:glutamyl-Q-tRNA synthetase [Nitrincola lacisaponensis]|uniref:Glutamyl-Q tRNA(Asp) synthetase n=1 Tax=Nitrincola lacisaponensis TaxID=267850 RepID=A0A063Y0J7_9GAMM|nr:tRNA glutamyl-Q(34) synthetase GluQRS [Nitrincola lacisaponensis]KDE38705.1 glutamyl-Q-tRNA synthetase [Nitrincola lacisaponensis]